MRYHKMTHAPAKSRERAAHRVITVKTLATAAGLMKLMDGYYWHPRPCDNESVTFTYGLPSSLCRVTGSCGTGKRPGLTVSTEIEIPDDNGTCVTKRLKKTIPVRQGISARKLRRRLDAALRAFEESHRLLKYGNNPLGSDVCYPEGGVVFII